MLADNAPIPVLAASDLKRARKFYEDTLGLTVHRETAEGIMFLSGNGMLVVYPTEFAGTAKNTACMWPVADIRSEVDELRRAGVTFEHYDLAGTTWDGDIAIDQEGQRGAWFRDTEGNILAMTELPS
ncbi:MAG TPA: VOC family protein [Nitriliruptorales bacterium]|nr:VOC family protein [Nitriliruptorales bacterium]